MSTSALGGVVLALALVAAVVFVGVALHELNYASAHPFAYGPAKVIAWALALAPPCQSPLPCWGTP